jgi:nitric oxide reductase subunit B
MADTATHHEAALSPWWRYGVLIIMLAGFGVLIWIAADAYKIAAPIPDRVVEPGGNTVFTGDDIRAGQEVFLKHALMENGTLWGHGAYMGPDFSAQYLHGLAVDTGNSLAIEHFSVPSAEDLSEVQRSALVGLVRDHLSENRYDYATHTLRYTQAETDSHCLQMSQWKEYFSGSRASRGLPDKTISDPEELRQLTAFFAWAAWASVAHVPGKAYSYTNNFPYEPAVGNGPSTDAVLWSALSLIALLAGTAAVLFAFGKFDYLGWRSKSGHVHPQLLPGHETPSQRAVLKYFVIVPLLLLVQVLVGGALAHYRVEPQGFYGVDLPSIFPSSLLRTWHLQAAIFWIATAYMGGGLLLASAMGQREPRGQSKLVHLLFWALVLVVVGSMLGEWAGLKQLLGGLWFWFGHQGWEYLELGRAWQVLLVAGFVLWAVLLVRGVGAARKDPGQREIVLLFLGAAFAIPFFYLPAFFFGSTTHFTVVDTWRFWIIHLWVEGFFELFVTVMVATMFFKMDLVSLATATRVIYLDAILFLGSGIIGTGHHWYWTGQSNVSMALSATFSAMEVVPLVLLTLDASDFMRLTQSRCDVCGQQVILKHRWTFYFLIAVGVWNFIGAGIFGFLINLPVVSYYEVGTNLTANHGHAALMGVFGMLAVALVVFALRQLSTDEHWARVEKYVRVSFWGLNAGLALMVILNLFPSGIMQLLDVINNGYWHARSPAYFDQPLVVATEWARLPADGIFILAGAVPLVIAAVATYIHARRRWAAGA